MCNEPNQIITTTHRADGFGAQYMAFISAFAKARHDDYIYRHTPIKVLGHFGRQHQKVCDRANNFIGMKSDKEDDPKRMHNLADHFFNPPLFRGGAEYYTEEVLSEIREMYYSTPKPKPCKYDVAIHIRRGDVKNNEAQARRWISNKDYVKCIRVIKKKYPDYSICIYSEGKEHKFKTLEMDGVHFNLGGPMLRTFHDLVTAKVLVMGASSFSYAAGLLSDNTVHYVRRCFLSEIPRFKGLGV